MNDNFLARDIYLRHTGPDGNVYVMQHRVWNAERFIASQEESCRKVNEDQASKSGKPCTTAKVVQITPEAYAKERAAR